jgi:hypothetical protein
MALKFRRGTTAQKSGSLAFGEPYVNTTLGTLQIGLDSGDVTLSAIGTGSNLSVAGISGSSLDITGNAKIDGNVIIGGTITAKEIHTSVVSSSVLYESGSTQFGDSADDTHIFNGSVYMSHSLNTGYFRASNITGSENHLAYFTDEHSIAGASAIQITNSGSTIGVGTTGFNAAQPERLIVDNGDSFNIATFQSSKNESFVEVNIKNFGSGSNASTDLVLWNDISSETRDFLDLGLNSSNYSAGVLGYENDAYLTTTAADIYIGPYRTGSHAHTHLFGGGQWDTPAITIDNNNEIHISSSVLPDSANTFDLGSSTNYFKDLYLSTGSIKFVDNTGVVGGLSLNTLNSLTSATGSTDAKFQTLATYTGSINDKIAALIAYTGSDITTNNAQDLRLSNVEASAATALSTNNAQDAKLTSIQSHTSSVDGRFSGLATISASLILTASNHEQRLAANEAISGTFARTNSSNIFTGTQTITGSMYISGDMIVQGSSSLQNISASVVSIGTNIINLNNDTPAVRFGGISVFDSGSTAGTGSLFWDSENERWIYQKSSGSAYSGGMFISGPRNTGALGSEVGLTSNRLAVSVGGDHISSSQIYVDNDTVSIPGNLQVTGSIVGTIVGNASTANTLLTARLINGTSFDGSSNITIPNLVSGSSQISGITNGQLSNSSVTVTAGTGMTGGGLVSLGGTITLNNAGVTSNVAGTGISVSSATGASTITNTGVTSAVAGNAIDVSGATGAVTISHADTSTAANLSATSRTYVSALTFDTYGHVTGYSTGTESVTDTNTVTTNIAGTGISVSSGTGNSTISNTGVTSAVAGTGVSVSGATGAVTISIGQSVATNATPTFGNLTINGTITATGDITAFYTSDRRHKNNIQTITNALDKVKKLNGVTWEWNDDVNEVTKTTPTTGLIAQEVQAVLPQVVVERENGYLGLDYSKMMGLLVEAIKEQQIKIDNLTVEVETLKKKKGL